MSEESDWEFVDDYKDDSEGVLVEMEMPPGGITSSPNVPEIVFSKPSGDLSCASSSFSLVEKIGAVGINDSASMSSFASSYAMSSASANHSIGTLISSFEVVSLSSGEVVLHCKRCRTRHPLDTKICQTCYLALCANPCENVDEQIAMALQRQEEKYETARLKAIETKRQNLKTESKLRQAEFLTEEILLFLKPYLTGNFKAFSDLDLKLLASSFIAVAEKRIYDQVFSIALKSAFSREWNQLRFNGYAKEINVKVREPTDTAIELYRRRAKTEEAVKKSEDINKCEEKKVPVAANSNPLGPIIEDETFQPKMNGNDKEEIWIVATVDFDPDIRNDIRNLSTGEQILPLACYDAGVVDADSVLAVVNGLSHICNDFFNEGLDLGTFAFQDERKAEVTGSSDDYKFEPISNEPFHHDMKPSGGASFSSGASLLSDDSRSYNASLSSDESHSSGMSDENLGSGSLDGKDPTLLEMARIVSENSEATPSLLAQKKQQQERQKQLAQLYASSKRSRKSFPMQPDGKSSKKSKKEDKKPKDVEDEYFDEVEPVLPIVPPAPVMLSSSGFAVYRNDKSVEELREELSEVSKRLKSIESETSNELAEMQKDVDEKKKKLKKDFGKQIDAAKKSNQKEDKKIKKENDESQKIVEGLRDENKKLREQKGRYPKQIKEVLASNDSLKKANEEIVGHFKSLSTFSKKLQKDHNRLVRTTDSCRTKYLPSYRNQLRERKDYIAVDTKVKNLYRDAMIRTCNRVVQTRDPQLIDDVSTTAIKVEREFNPSFDPKIFFKNEENESDADSDSD